LAVKCSGECLTFVVIPQYVAREGSIPQGNECAGHSGKSDTPRVDKALEKGSMPEGYAGADRGERINAAQVIHHYLLVVVDVFCFVKILKKRHWFLLSF
jgi:hypothetical protein